MKLVHLVGFITRKFVTIHGHMNVKFISFVLYQMVPMKIIQGVLLSG